MGEGALAGMPLQLAGTRQILEFMDWGDYGAMGTFINIGSIGIGLTKPLILLSNPFSRALKEFSFRTYINNASFELFEG